MKDGYSKKGIPRHRSRTHTILEPAPSRRLCKNTGVHIPGTWASAHTGHDLAILPVTSAGQTTAIRNPALRPVLGSSRVTSFELAIICPEPWAADQLVRALLQNRLRRVGVHPRLGHTPWCLVGNEGMSCRDDCRDFAETAVGINSPILYKHQLA